MTGILLSGALGKMGAAVRKQCESFDSLRIVAGLDIAKASDIGFPVFSSPSVIDSETLDKIDVIIDFSHPSALAGLLEFAVRNGKPAIIATTGLNEAQVNLIKTAATKTPVFYTANLSIGVGLLCELAKKAAKVLGNSFDIEIVEMHHNQKIDAPSGTALMLADAIAAELDGDTHFEFDRHSKREKRTKAEIGLHAVRGGTITGEHEIIFAGHDEIIKLSHSARSKELFATGALNAARFLAEVNEAGLYTMADLMS